MTDHPLTEAHAAELWDGVPRRVVAFEWEDMNAEEMAHALAAMRATFDAGREHESEHTDPRHDPRPWQDCTREDICAGDLVEARRGDSLIVGVAHDQNGHGDWWAEDGWHLTWGDRWPLRRIPAPVPPAEVVELPTEHPAHLLDVKGVDGDVCDHMALDRFGRWRGVDQCGVLRDWTSHFITACTLPDGTRARRDGDRADGKPRFIKVQEAQA